MASALTRSIDVDTTTEADLEVIVDRLRATFRSGRTRTLTWRRRQLEALIRLCSENEQAMADALAQDLGRTPSEAYLADNGGIQLEARHALDNLDAWTRRRRVRLPLTSQPAQAWTEYEPLGTVLIIGAWNYPIYLTLGPLVGVLAAGNCAIIKPSELAPVTTALLARLVEHYLDPDAVAVVSGDAETTQALIDADLDHVMFTGSARVGRLVMERAARTLTPVTLELGGKCPLIVAEDADLKVAARRVAWAKLTNAGQTCITVDYVLVHKRVRDRFLDLLAQTYDDFWAKREQKDHAAQQVVSTQQFQRLAGLLDDHGGTVLRGGGTYPERNQIDPTIIVDPTDTSELMADEIFGPILPVRTVDSVTDAIEFVRGRPKPLAAYVFSNDRDVQRRVIDGVSTGAVVINHIGLHCLTPELPFGGVGASGMGAYHGEQGFHTFSHRKPVLRKWARPDPPVIYPPVRRWKLAVMRKLF